MSELATMSTAELKKQAAILSINLDGNESDDEIRSLIASVLGEAEPEAKPRKPAKAAAKAAGKGLKDTVTIVIAEDEKDPQPAFVGHNGKSYRIRRGEPVEVPAVILNSLDLAVQTVYDAKGNARRVKTYPYQIVG